MFNLLGKRLNPYPGAWPLALLLYVAGMSLAHGQLVMASGVFIAATLVAFHFIPQVKRMWRRQPEWLLFTNQGIGSAQTEGKFVTIPWKEFKRVTVRRPFNFKKSVDGLDNWDIRLYREDRLAIRKAANDVIFRIRATELEATQIIHALRQRFSQGWAPENHVSQ